MYDRIDVPSELEYPEDGLLAIQGMLSAAVDINNYNPNSENLKGEHIRRVIKRGFTTKTTVGTLSTGPLWTFDKFARTRSRQSYAHGSRPVFLLLWIKLQIDQRKVIKRVLTSSERGELRYRRIGCWQYDC
ncbi:hypothetical protein FRC19_007508 [Serendipita sp. 401]|nr:hypothetical protein FRC15_001623 [Serendipita sp. 397]KAG8813856.1 hypothetical protein FRC18_002253 [Serendipita sp. 400]KAG8821642.1 hypothetical protein FRC19_007508 [Serendipita sp. 401]